MLVATIDVHSNGVPSLRHDHIGNPHDNWESKTVANNKKKQNVVCEKQI
jgi:hypothetical protein